MASSALAAEDSGSSQPTYKWSPQLQLESDIGIGHNSRDIGLPQMMVPLWQNNDSMVFTSLRFRFDNEQSQEYNIGLGYRKEITNDWILGGYGFFDRLSSADGYLYSQATLGAEALSVKNDARVNIYIPQSTIHGTPGGGEIEILGNQIGVAGSAERALPGEDFELGQKLPFNFADVRIYGGGYRYTADNFGMESGPRGRIEFTLNDHYLPEIPFGAEVTLGGEIEHDQVRGTEQFAVLKLRIPLGGTGVRHSTDTLDERMHTFVQRDIDVVEHTGNGSAGSLQPVEVNGAPITSVTTINPGITFTNGVNNAPANSLILLNGNGGTTDMSGDVTMKPGQAILGGGGSLTLTSVNTGRNYTYTYVAPTPTVNDGPYNDTIYMANNTLINNVNFTGSFGTISTSANNIVISNINMAQAGQAVTVLGGNNIAISNVIAPNTPFAGIVFEGTESNVSITNSQFNNAGFSGVDLDGANVTNLAINNVQMNGAGFAGLLVDGGSVNGFTYNNSQTNSSSTGIDLDNTTITALSGSGNSNTGNASACIASGSISGSVTYNGSSHCP